MEHTIKVECRLNFIRPDMASGIHRTCTSTERIDRGTADRNRKRDSSMFIRAKNTLCGCIAAYSNTATFS